MTLTGKIYDIDLTQGGIEALEFTEAMAREYLGGFGFAVATLYREVPAGTDPLGPENLLVIGPGLLTGSAAPCAARLHLCARSPQSGLMGSSNVGGFMGARLAALEVRGLILRGRAPCPVELHLGVNGPRILDARHLWGLDTRETQARLRRDHGDGKLETLVIGRAGENHLPMACIMAGPDHSAGRNGLGAVMGAKNLKAISAAQAKVTDGISPRARETIKRYVRSIRETIPSRYADYSQRGSAGDVLELNQMGLLGTRNYQAGQIADADRIDGRRLGAYVKRRTACHKCPVHCKAEIEIPRGRHKGFKGGRPEYETILDLGPLCGLTDPEELLYLSNLCNILGMDTISTGSIIAFAMDLFERGILTPEDTDGLVLNWGDARVMETLMRAMANREGFGGTLAQGVKQAAQVIGRGAEGYAYHVKGVEMYGADPRGLSATALAYAVSLRGGDFTSVYPIPEFRYTPEQAEREFGSTKAVEFTATEGKGALVGFCMRVSSVMDALGLCKVAALSVANHFDLTLESQLLEVLTGIALTPAELMHIGEGIITMEKLFNLRQGADAALDTLPDKFTREAVPRGPAQGARADLAPMIADFYRTMGWDTQGVPLPETLRKHGLDPAELTNQP